MESKKIYQANLILTVLLILASYFHAWTGVGAPLSSSEMSTNAAVPLGFFFVIWWVIFAGLIYFSYTLFVMNRKELKKITQYVSISLILCIIWAVATQVRGGKPFWFLPLILLAAYIFATRAYLEAPKAIKKINRRLYWKVIAPLGLFAGWLGLAFFINVSAVVDASGGALMRLASGDQAAVLIFLATILSLYITYRAKSELSYPIAVLWGMFGIFLGHFGTLVGDVALFCSLAIVLGTALMRWLD